MRRCAGEADAGILTLFAIPSLKAKSFSLLKHENFAVFCRPASFLDHAKVTFSCYLRQLPKHPWSGLVSLVVAFLFSFAPS
jgi:hypothetical protein